MELSKVFKVMLTSVALSTMLTACSSGDSSSTPQVQVTEENKSYLEEYDQNFQSYMKEMTIILQGFNNSLDKMYTQEFTHEQFISALKNSINESNTLVTNVETLDVDPSLFESHQSLITLVNGSHQLLLTAIDKANNPDRELDKYSLRDQYMRIKEDQAKMANQWKILRNQLSEEGQEETTSAN